ncbi:hypothetical protein ACOME3_005535 [Neoechinorhynchus agilis]
MDSIEDIDDEATLRQMLETTDLSNVPLRRQIRNRLISIKDRNIAARHCEMLNNLEDAKDRRLQMKSEIRVMPPTVSRQGADKLNLRQMNLHKMKELETEQKMR